MCPFFSKTSRPSQQIMGCDPPIKKLWATPLELWTAELTARDNSKLFNPPNSLLYKN